MQSLQSDPGRLENSESLIPRCDFLITGRHTFSHLERMTALPHGGLLVFETPAAAVLQIIPPATHFLSLVPSHGEGLFLHDGFEVAREGFSVSAPGKGAILRIDAPGSFAVAWISKDTTPIFSDVRHSSSSQRMRAFRQIEKPFEFFDSDGDFSHRAAALEYSLLEALGANWNEPQNATGPRRPSVRAEIVHEVWNTMRNDPVAELSIDEWSRRVGASVRTIEYAFEEIVGTTAVGFIRRWRFAQARRLLDQGLVKTVKDAAFGNGLMHLGRFSVDYRLHFGESPSQTLARSRPELARKLRVLETSPG
ncbi:MAG: helix-turn-helix domain-containing protein [Verrucomicrobiota bacterium]